MSAIVALSSENPVKPLPPRKRNFLRFFCCCFGSCTSDEATPLTRGRVVKQKGSKTPEIARTSLGIPPPLEIVDTPSVQISNIGECVRLYSRLLDHMKIKSVGETLQFMNGSDIYKLDMWMQTSKQLCDNTRKYMKSLSEDWASLTFQTVESFTQQLSTMHYHYSRYFSFFFDVGPLNFLYLNQDRPQRLSFSPDGEGRKIVRESLLDEAIDRLADLREFHFYTGDNLEGLRVYIRTFHLHLEPKLVVIENMLSKMGRQERLECLLELAKCKAKYNNDMAGPVRAFKEEHAELFKTLSKSINAFLGSIVEDLSQVRVQYERYSAFETAFASHSKGFQLHTHEGLPRKWPIVIPNPFGGEHIVLDGGNNWIEYPLDFPEDIVGDAVDLKYVRVTYGGVFFSSSSWKSHFEAVSGDFPDFRNALEEGLVLRNYEGDMFIRDSYWAQIQERLPPLPMSTSQMLAQHYVFPEDERSFQEWMTIEAPRHPEWFQIPLHVNEYMELRTAALNYGELIEEHCYGQKVLAIRKKEGMLRSIAKVLAART